MRTSKRREKEVFFCHKKRVIFRHLRAFVSDARAVNKKCQNDRVVGALRHCQHFVTPFLPHSFLLLKTMTIFDQFCPKTRTFHFCSCVTDESSEMSKNYSFLMAKNFLLSGLNCAHLYQDTLHIPAEILL